ERRHRAEVAGGVVRHVHLRRHLPVAAMVSDERAPHRVHCLIGRHGQVDVPRREDGNPRHSVLTPATSLRTDSFASPKSITVFGSRKSGLSIPAKPGLIERFMTTICFELSTSRIGMP